MKADLDHLDQVAVTGLPSGYIPSRAGVARSVSPATSRLGFAAGGIAVILFCCCGTTSRTSEDTPAMTVRRSFVLSERQHED